MPILKRAPALFPADFFALESDWRWWVAHTLSRREKRVTGHLLELKIPFYLPLTEKTVRREGRTLTSFLPLFPGYVFFRADLLERRQAIESNLLAGVLDVPDQHQMADELADLWRLQRAGRRLTPHPYPGPGDEIRIVDGPFKDLRGKVIRTRGTLRLVVSITLLQRSVATEIDRDLAELEPAEPPAQRSRPHLVTSDRPRTTC